MMVTIPLFVMFLIFFFSGMLVNGSVTLVRYLARKRTARKLQRWIQARPAWEEA